MADNYYGHATAADGTHVLLSEKDAQEIWAYVEQQKVIREVSMPTTADALAIRSQARERMRELGWRDGCYCPKDGTPFAAIQHGSTGIFTATMTEEWPYGWANLEDEGCHPSGFLWKPIDQLTEAEDAARIQAGKDSAAHIERTLESFAAMDDRPSDEPAGGE